MTKEQETLERIKKRLTRKADYNTGVWLAEQDIETVLNMLKEKDAEIEKYKKLLADNLARNLNDSIKAKEKADTDLDDLNKGWQVELEKYKQLYNKALDDAVITAHDNMKKDKIIDLYIDELVTNMFDRCCQECCRECEKDKDTLRNCTKQYFERRLENE